MVLLLQYTLIFASVLMLVALAHQSLRLYRKPAATSDEGAS